MAVEPKSAVEHGAAGPYESRVTRPEDKEGIRQLFQEVFKDEMTEALWQWKYERPESKGAVVLKGGKIVAHYGGLGRWVLREGIRCLAVQIGDVMVAAGVRHSVRSNSPFFLVFTTFAEAYLGFDKLFPFAFGFPNIRAYRIAQQLGLYSKVDCMSEVRWTARRLPLGSRLRYGLVRLREEDLLAASDTVARLWGLMSGELRDRIVGVRDNAWLQYRYFQRPEKHYEVYLLLDRLTRIPQAVVVLQPHEDHLLWVDWVGSLKYRAALTGVLRDLAVQRGKPEVRTWSASHDLRLFQASGGEVSTLPIVIPANIWTPGPSVAELSHRWWLMPGDTDFQ